MVAPTSAQNNSRSHSLNQNLLNVRDAAYSYLNTDPIKILICDESKVTFGHLKAFGESKEPLGLSIGLHPRDQTVLAIAIYLPMDRSGRCLIIEFPTLLGSRPSDRGPQSLHFDAEKVRSMIQTVLCRSIAGLYAFDSGPLALLLFGDLGIHITQGVDIQSAVPDSTGKRKSPLAAILNLVGEAEAGIQPVEENIGTSFEDLTYNDRKTVKLSSSQIHITQRAWIAHFIATFQNAEESLAIVPRINTMDFSKPKLDLLFKWAQDSLRLHYLKSLNTVHDISEASFGSEGLEVKSKLFKNKLRTDQHIQLQLQNKNGVFTLPAATGGVEGRSAAIAKMRSVGTNIQVSGKVFSRGRDGPTAAENKKSRSILKALQGLEDPFDNPWIKSIYDGVDISWPENLSILHSTSPISVPETKGRSFNLSQILAIKKMLSFSIDDHIILIRGPPGSGKTSVISRFVEIACSNQQFEGIWLIAQSNVAVKNIAEKLASVGFLNWKLLISKDFHYDWHEHLYGSDIENNIIRSDDFRKVSSSKLKGCKVILSTLIPVQTLVVDEASQIEIGSYLPVFLSPAKTLRKICFIGDDKQLAPHGQEDIQKLQSVFELDHLTVNHLYLLDTQYRMPPQMGDFISKSVYNGLLKSNPQHPITNKDISCHFIDVMGIEEREKDSFINKAEASAVLSLAAHLEDSDKNYRIITPYDSQRNHIEIELQNKGLKWHDKCFNVDSFQGNEDDFIIVSIVRSMSPGFLTNLRRTNVMLTRFRRKMFIVTSKKFTSGAGAKTLLGSLVTYYEEEVGDAVWLKVEDIENKNFILK